MATAREPQPRRRYDGELRRRRAAETRHRIVEAGAAILHEHAIWNWDALTFRGVAERAGVNERTVYRHFENERALRDAVMRRLEQEAGVEIDDLRLDDLQQTTERVLAYVSSFPLEPRAPQDATLMTAGAHLREVLLKAVEQANPEWTGRDRSIAAAALDVLWSVEAYERHVAGWGLSPDDAIRSATWVIGLVEQAIRNGDRPSR